MSQDVELSLATSKRLTGRTLALCLVISAGAPVFSFDSPARAQSWNMYQGGTSLEIYYTAGALNDVSNGVPRDRPALIDVAIAGGTVKGMTIDTGSTGIAISAALLPSLAAYKPLGPGTINYDSSGAAPSGYFYELPVNLLGGTSGGSPATGSTTVKVLVVTSDDSTRYFGIGNNRNNVYSGVLNPALSFAQNVALGNLTQVSAVGMNPLINVSVNGTPLPHQGYVVMNDRIFVGLTSANNGYSFVQLTPDAANGPNLWNGIPIALAVGTGAATGGTILHDTGIDYAFLKPFGQDNETVNVFMPGASATGAFYSFAITRSDLQCATMPSNAMTPCYVKGSTSSTPFLNTGRQFYAGFDYLFDPINGFAGYGLSASGLTTSATLNPMLALTGTLALRNGFTTDFDAYLMGNTTFSQTGTGTFSGTISGPGGLTISDGTVNLLGSNTFTGGLWLASGGTLRAGSDAAMGAAAGGLNFAGGMLQATAGFAIDRPVTLGSGGGTIDTNGNELLVRTAIGGSGGLTKVGTGFLTLSGANSYQGGTTINAGTLRLAAGASLPTTGALTVNAGTLDVNGNDVTVGSLAGGGGTIALGASTLAVAGIGSTSFAGTITGTGGLNKSGNGLLNLTGANTYTGPTSITGGRLAVNGSITSDVTVGPGGNLGGAGTIFGNVVNDGAVAPGNSIGTLAVNGSYTQAAGSSYTVETNAQGQSDRIAVSGAPGTATIAAGTSVLVAPASTSPYAPRTTYTILSASGGVTGTYSSVASNLPFLLPSLSYDANNVYLALQIGGFARQAQTPNQAAVGAALDAGAIGATGDFATVLGAFSTMNAQQGVAALNTISGQNYSAFSSAGIATTQIFMTNFANTVGGTSGGGNRVALAQACDVACDSSEPARWGAWGGALGGFGVVGGTANAGTLTYNLGGFAAGLDRRVTDELLVGVTAGFTSGSQWVGGFSGRGLSDTFQAGLYASYAKNAVYVDGLAAYAYSDNQMQRQITIPGLSRTANGRTGANLFFGQLEAGYRFDIGGRADAYITPFARLQGATATQSAFSESGAGALDLSVAAQTTNSLRSVLGAQLGGALDLGWRDRLAMTVKLGWGHEYADTARPVTASFVGAPASGFTTYGAAPQRDSVVLGLSASTAIADATSLYFRYEGNISSQDSNQALTAGFRMTW
ncbi:autotransporter outer membrane beta-barrel domain-containing protein [Reyranella sp.]|uniref:autotransporter outer membrane beta-barrel domain-containing protein n=1 Tax=Reyranella sp. TaxID=1929291 RepID=UPI003BAB9E29